MSTLSEIMDGLAGLADILTPQTYAYPPQSVTIPCVVVGYPTAIEYDETFMRGADRFELPVWFLVGPAGTLEARNDVFNTITGLSSIKEHFDGNHSFGAVRVTEAVPEEVTVGPLTYLGAKFTTEVIV